MPIDFPDPSRAEDQPSSPNPIVWLTLLVVVLATGVAWTLLNWPKNQPTGTPWFWMQLVGYPGLAWCVLFGFRLHFYEEESNYLAAREVVRLEDRAEAIAFGAEPLAVLGAVYLCAMEPNGVSARIAQRESALRARVPKPRMQAIRHARLAMAETGADEKEADRYRQTFEALLKAIDKPLRALPPKVPFDVRLRLPDDAEPERLREVWKSCWNNGGLRQAEVMLLPAKEGLMMLDTWLDEYGGPALETFTLFVAVQLHGMPQENSGEVGAALLLGWAPLAERKDLVSIAMLHRPVACETDGLSSAITTAALCGRAKPEDLQHLWQSGLSKADKTALLKCGSDVALGAAQTDELSGVHDIDPALGVPGVGAAWFGAALAIEAAQQDLAPQLLACREGALRLAVVRPIAQQNEREAT